MKLTVLGSGTSVPHPERGSAGYLVESGSTRLLLDCGRGTLDKLARLGIDPLALDAVLPTHAHIDHITELPALLFAYNLPHRPRRAPFRIVASAPFLELLGRLRGVFGPWLEAREYPMALEPCGDGTTVEIGELSIRTGPVRHTETSVAFRLTETATGRSLVYSGDTAYSPELVRLAHRADLFLCECSFPDGSSVDGHVTPSEAGRMATEAEVHRLLLTHFYPECDDAPIAEQCARRFTGPLGLARDMMVVEV